jgi:hypothetical protein
MAYVNKSLRQLMLEEDGNRDLQYKVNLNGETFQVNLDVDKNGINLELVPVSPDGEMIYNLSEEEIKTLQNSLMTSLGPKFAKYKLELNAEDSNSESPSVKMNIPIGSLFPFIKTILSR